MGCAGCTAVCRGAFECSAVGRRDRLACDWITVKDEEYLAFAADIVVGHHEKWDGSGYPNGLAGEKIPLPARIMAIADVFDALISKRCYKEAMPVEEAFEVIRRDAGIHFDPNLAEVFLRHKEDFI